MKTRLISGQIDAPASSESTGEAPATLDRPVRAVYEGTFNSMDGEVTLTAQQIDQLAANHNAKIDAILAGGAELKLADCPPLQLDHSESARDTIGRIWGKLEAKTAQVEGLGLKRCLFGVARFIGKENTAPAMDGRWTTVSVGIDLDTLVLDEISVVPFPAAERAALLSKGRFSMKPEHLKHFLVSCKQMSEDDALKHMGGLDEEGRKSLEGEYTEHLKKLGVEGPKGEEGNAPATPGVAGEAGEEHLADGEEEGKEHLGDGDGDADDKDEKKKMARGKLSAKLAETKKALAKAQMELRRGTVRASLSRLRAEAKITPAEEKNLLELGLHEMSDKSLGLFMKTFEAREPVIHTGHFGSVRGVDLASMGDAMKKARLAEQEKETLSNMPFTRQALAATREAEGRASAQLADGNEGKVVRLMVADHMEEAARYDREEADREAKAAQARAIEDAKGTAALGEQVTQLTALVSALETTL